MRGENSMQALFLVWFFLTFWTIRGTWTKNPFLLYPIKNTEFRWNPIFRISVTQQTYYLSAIFLAVCHRPMFCEIFIVLFISISEIFLFSLKLTQNWVPFMTDPSCHAIWGAGLQQLTCWGSGFESRWKDECLLRKLCDVQACDGPIPRPQESYWLWMCHTSTMSR